MRRAACVRPAAGDFRCAAGGGACLSQRLPHLGVAQGSCSQPAARIHAVGSCCGCLVGPAVMAPKQRSQTRRVQPTHGPRGLRERGHRLSAAAASAICHVLMPDAAAPDVPLGMLSQLLALALEDDSEDVFDLLSVRSGPYTVREALRFRAQRLLSNGAPSCSLWHTGAAVRWPASFRQHVRSLWYSMGRSRRALHSAPSSSTQQLRGTSIARASTLVPPATKGRVRFACVGRLRCAYPDVLPCELEQFQPAAFISEVQLPSVPLSCTLAGLIPTADCEDLPTDSQQHLQRRRFAAVGYDRVCGSDQRAFFQPAKLSNELLSCPGWRGGAIGVRLPTLAALRRTLWTKVGPTALAASNHHLWDACCVRPLTARQYCFYFGLERWAADLLRARLVVTACQFRSLMGQACHAATMHAAFHCVKSRMLPSAVEQVCTFGSLGAGINTMALVLRDVFPHPIQYSWWAEGCCIAMRAHDALWAGLGEKPNHWTRAEDVGLASSVHHVGCETMSLRCAPFSPKSKEHPKGCAAALMELAAVLQGVAARRPIALVCENTSGLWRTPLWRARVEFLLRYYLPDYAWESMLHSPHIHAGVPVRRLRAIYMAVLRSVLRAPPPTVGRVATPSPPPLEA